MVRSCLVFSVAVATAALGCGDPGSEPNGVVDGGLVDAPQPSGPSLDGCWGSFFPTPEETVDFGWPIKRFMGHTAASDGADLVTLVFSDTATNPQSKWACSIELKRAGVATLKVAAREDCDLLQRFYSGLDMFDALRASSPAALACKASAVPMKTEYFDLGLQTPGYQRLFEANYCNVEPYVTARRCLGRLVARYF